MRRSTTAYAIAVNPIRCDAYGYCAELLPELVSLDEWGYPVVGDERIPAPLLERAKAAAAQCPRRAFLVLRQQIETPRARAKSGGARQRTL